MRAPAFRPTATLTVPFSIKVATSDCLDPMSP